MASLVSIDYNPLRRATSNEYSSRDAESSAAQRISLARQTLSNRVWQNEINVKKVQLEKDKLKEQERQKQENAAWTAVLGVVKMAAGTAMMAFVPGGQIIGAGLIAGGGVDVVGGSVDAASGTDFLGGAAYSKIQQGISLGASVGQQIVNYQTDLADKDATAAINRMMATQAAQGALNWNIDQKSGQLGIARTPDMAAAIAAINEQYGGDRGTKAFENYETSHLAQGANAKLNQMTALQEQIVTHAMGQYLDGDINADRLNGAIDGLGGAPLQTQELKKNAWNNTVGELLKNEAGKAALEEGDEGLNSLLNGNTSTGAMKTALKELANAGPTAAQYAAAGYSPKDAGKLASAPASSLGEIKYDAKGNVTGIDVNAAGKKALRQIADDAVKEKKAELTDKAAKIFNENIKARMPVEVAAQNALAVTDGGNIKNSGVLDAVKSKVFSLRKQAVTQRFDREYNLAKTDQAELKELMKKYDPETGEYGESFKEMKADQEYYYDILSKRHGELKAAAEADAERRKAADRKLSLKQAAADAKAAQQAAGDIRLEWQNGHISGHEWMSVLEITKNALPASDYNEWMEEVVMGGTAHKPTKESFKGLQKFLDARYDKGQITSERRLELYKSVYDTRMSVTGDDIKPVEEAIKSIMDIETAGYLEKAMTGVSLGRGLDSKLYHRILGADLDAYFGGAYTAALNRDTGKLDVKYGSQTVGGERMERVMDAVKNQSVEILAGKLGLKPEDVKMRMMTDGQGDPEGYYVADITTGGRTETVRLASKKGLLGTDGTKVRILNGEGVWEETDYGTLLARIKKGLGEFGQKAQKAERPNAGYYGR